MAWATKAETGALHMKFGIASIFLGFGNDRDFRAMMLP